MAQIETWFNQDLKQAVRVHYIDGNVFSADNNGNIIGVNVFDDGEPATLGGTVSASIIRADGATVAATGTLSGNQVSVSLPQSAYAVPGVISIVLKLTSGTDITTLLAVVGNVYQSTTDTVVDPGTILPSIETLIAAIEAAVASIPADYSSLWTSLAQAYSTSATYAVGQYVTYNGGLYRCISAISSGESWTAAHWTEVSLGNDVASLENDVASLENDVASLENDVASLENDVSDLNSAFDYVVTDIIEPTSLFNRFLATKDKYIWNDGTLYDNSEFITSDFIAVEPNKTYFGNFTNHCLFFTSDKTPISESFTNTVKTVTSPANGYYVRFDCRITTVPIDDIFFVEQNDDIPFEYKYKLSDIVTISEKQKGLSRELSENLFDLSTYVLGEYVSTADGSFQSNSSYARSDFIRVTPNLNYVGNYTNHVCWYDKTRTFISGTNLVFSSIAPATARFAVIDFNTTRISAENIMFIQANSLPSQYVPKEKPLYRIPYEKILGGWPSIWKGKNVLFYGDSITAQINGDSPTGWGKPIFDTFSLDSIHGKGVGGQTFVWNNNTFQADANGNYVSRGTSSDNCLGCFPSWQRISTMIPASICNSIDVVVVMGGTNDFDGVEEISGGTSIDYNEPLWSSGNTTDSAWISSNEYNGGDYDVNTFCGAVASTIMKMQKRCPNAIIVLASPLSRSDLTNHKPTVKNGKTTQDMAETQEKIAHYMSVPFFDITTKCGINAWNQATYYQDAVHPNTNGGKLLARTFISELIGLFPRLS